jgi:hypothetical protein
MDTYFAIKSLMPRCLRRLREVRTLMTLRSVKRGMSQRYGARRTTRIFQYAQSQTFQSWENCLHSLQVSGNVAYDFSHLVSISNTLPFPRTTHFQWSDCPFSCHLRRLPLPTFSVVTSPLVLLVCHEFCDSDFSSSAYILRITGTVVFNVHIQDHRKSSLNIDVDQPPHSIYFHFSE